MRGELPFVGDDELAWCVFPEAETISEAGLTSGGKVKMGWDGMVGLAR